MNRLSIPILLLVLAGFPAGLGAGPAAAGVLRDAIAREQGWSLAERQDVQSRLVWSGDYSGRLDGDFGPATRSAIEAFQQRNGLWVTGYLTEDGIVELNRQRRAAIRDLGYDIRDFAELGLSIGLPEALFGAEQPYDFGQHFTAAHATGLPALTLYSAPPLTRRQFKDFFRDAIARDAYGGDEYEVFRGDWFVFTGRSGDGTKQYTYMRNTDDGVRGFALFYARRDADTLDRIAVAMFNSLDAFAARGGRTVTGVPETPRFLPPGRVGAAAGGDRARDRAGTGGGAAGRKGTSEPEDDPADGYVAAREPDAAPDEPEAEPQLRRPESRRNQPRSRRDRDAEPGSGDRADRTPPRRDQTPRHRDRPRRNDDRVVASGSGFFVNDTGSVVTNHHVIEGCGRLFINGETPGHTLRYDSDIDLALVQAEIGDATPFLSFRPGRARLNEDVTVIGFPLWGLLDDINVTRGAISGLAGIEGDKRMVQITAPVQSGNSGGPVLDSGGRVVGVVQSKLDAVKLAEELGEIAQNINFAIDARLAQEFLTGAGTGFTLSEDATRLSPPDLADQARQATVLIECLGE